MIASGLWQINYSFTNILTFSIKINSGKTKEDSENE